MRQKNRRGTDKVIHVVFGPGGGRVESRPHRAEGSVAKAEHDLPDTREPITDLFSGTEVSRLLGFSAARLRTLDRAGVVSPSGRRRGRRAYTFGGSHRAAHGADAARAAGATARRDPRHRRAAAIAAQGDPAAGGAARGLRRATRRGALARGDLRAADRADAPRSRDQDACATTWCACCAPRPGKERSQTAYNLYVRASQLDEDPATMKDAEALYREALELDPWLAIAYTNLGNICFRKGEEADAEKLYRRALEIDARQPEAQYNLGYIMLERGKAVDAIPYFLGAIEADPRFADAYFNLAMAYEGIGDAVRARPCWKHYLELEPAGTWAEIARKHL